MSNPKVLIAIPMLGTVCADFFTSIMALKSYPNTQLGIEVNSLIYDARSRLLVRAVDNMADYILWIDSDMTFSPDMLHRLMEDAKEGRDFVSGLCFKRCLPISPTICKSIIWKHSNHAYEGAAAAYEDYPKDQVFEIAGSGLACCLMKTSFALDVGSAYNMNPFTPLPNLGEDYSFCWRAGQIGKTMYCDSRVKVGHVGTLVYDEKLYLSQKWE